MHKLFFDCHHLNGEVVNTFREVFMPIVEDLDLRKDFGKHLAELIDGCSMFIF